MSTHQETIGYLLEQLHRGQATAEECRQLKELICSDSTGDSALQANVFFSGKPHVTDQTGEPTAYWQQAIQEILEVDAVTPSQQTVQRVPFIRESWFRYAAILLLIVGTVTWLWLRPPGNSGPGHPAPSTSLANRLTDIPPGGNKAMLTLTDGSTIELDSAANGALAQQGGTTIWKRDAGSLTYQGTAKTGIVGMNTVSTPAGGQYQVTLPDGTKVWLNAVSSIRFSTSFIKERKVTITGEAYFEIARNKEKPFIVETHQDTITVLGTSFNVNSYVENHVVKTSLMEGAVRVGNCILHPGEGYSNGKIIQTDLEQDLAWKNGVFNFKNTRLPEIMQQLARWYDIEVHYEPALATVEFGGKMGRNLTLQQVLKGLEGMEGIHFQLDGKTLSAKRK